MRVEEPSGRLGKARPRIESVISEQTFEEFLDAAGTWDNESERRESQGISSSRGSKSILYHGRRRRRRRCLTPPPTTKNRFQKHDPLRER
jgi:hypothetical protein